MEQVVEAPPGRTYCGDGLCLVVSPDGRKRKWIYRYKSLVTGRPTETTLASAWAFTQEEVINHRLKHLQQMLAQGEDPVGTPRSPSEADHV
jgi:hypothetical protein